VTGQNAAFDYSEEEAKAMAGDAKLVKMMLLALVEQAQGWSPEADKEDQGRVVEALVGLL